MTDAHQRKVAPKMYSPRIVAYLDILGFRALIKRTLSNPLVFDLVYLLLDGLSRGGKQWESSDAATEAWEVVAKPRGMTEEEHDAMVARLRQRNKATAFSDNIVLSAPLDWGGLTHIVTTAGALSLELLRGGAFLRGAITSGLLVHEDNLVFGPALVSAYELELRTARVTRIIVDRMTETHFMERVSENPAIAAIISRMLRTDTDGVTHLHILGETAMAAAGLMSERQRYFQLAREVVASRHREALREQDRVAVAKVQWFGDYFNHVVSKEPELGVAPIALQDIGIG